MFSKELEEVIEAALADGVITEKELAVLHKRAQAEGVDPDELDVVIEGRLSKMKKEEDWLRPVPPPQPKQNNKHGVVRKCPSCGATVDAGTIRCAECGYEFVGIEANSSMEKLAKLLQEIDAREVSDTSVSAKFLGSDATKRLQEKGTAISNFPVPSTRDDLLEFILALQPKTFYSSNTHQFLTGAYRDKYKECINKARLFFANDPQFKPLLEQYDKDRKKLWANMPLQAKMGWGCLIFFVLFSLLLAIFS